jgi:nitrile hydratase
MERDAANFKPGDRVRISSRTERRHHRVPAYAKGRVGVVERVCPVEFAQPEEVAYGKSSASLSPLYRVRLKQRDLWPDYEGPAHDTLDLEIFENWLEPSRETHGG